MTNVRDNYTFFDKSISLCPNNKQTNNYMKMILVLAKEFFKLNLQCTMKANTTLRMKQIDLKDSPLRFMAKGINGEQFFVVNMFEEISPPHNLYVGTFWNNKIILD
jgi:hypothetical protein